MSNDAAKILITRPHTTGKALAQELEALKYQTMLCPMIEIEPRPYDDIDISLYGGLVFTSAHAIRLFASEHSETTLPVFCVGDQSAKIAYDLGFNNVHSAGGGVLELQQLLVTAYQNKDRPLLYLRGEDIKLPLIEMADLKIEERIIYKAQPVEKIEDNVSAALKNNEIGLVLFFSKRTAAIFINTALKNGLEQEIQAIKALCISESVLEYVRNYTWADSYASAQPTRESMIQSLQSVCPP